MLVLAVNLDPDSNEVVIGPIPPEAVGETIRVVNVGFRSGCTRLGFEATDTIPINRKRIFEAMMAKNGFGTEANGHGRTQG